MSILKLASLLMVPVFAVLLAGGLVANNHTYLIIWNELMDKKTSGFLASRDLNVNICSLCIASY